MKKSITFVVSLMAGAAFFTTGVTTNVGSASAAADKLCVVLYHKGKGSVRAVAGSFEKRNAVKQLAKATPRWSSIGGGKYQGVFCVPRSRLAGVTVMTIVGQNGNYSYRGSDLAHFKEYAKGPNGPFGKSSVTKMWYGG